MLVKKNPFGLLVLTGLFLALPGAGAEKGKTLPPAKIAANESAVLWKDPADIQTRNLFYGSGGKEHVPHGPFRFVKEDLDGTNPKFVVKDQDGAKWKVKLGTEAQPETAATRLVWAVGYFTTDDYFFSDFQVEGMPAKLHRGQKLIGPEGSMHNVRLKREPADAKKIGTWKWRSDPFNDTREWNGLKTMMAVINNWDLKDENNAIYQIGTDRVYMVSDLGASFGTAGRSWPPAKTKGNVDSYDQSRFIRRITSNFVNFQVPARPKWVCIVNPKEYLMRIHLEWIGKNIPRADAKWMGSLLAQLSPDQIHDAFRAAGYSPADVDRFSQVLSRRISALGDL
jgi:hypothetical protein